MMNDCVKRFSSISVLRVFEVAVLVFVVLSPVFVQIDTMAQIKPFLDEEDHDCRFWGIVGNPESWGNVIKDHLLGDPDVYTSWKYCLKRLGGCDSETDIEPISGYDQFNNLNGWGLGYYISSALSTPISRGQSSAWSDDSFDTEVGTIAAAKPNIVVGHVRNAVGVTNIENPHPFYRARMEKDWLFGHNGVVSSTKVRELIVGIVNPSQEQLRDYFRGESNQWQIPKCYLCHHPDGGGGFRPCNPLTDDDACLFGDIEGFPYSELKGIVDSELYFVFLLKHIESADWNVSNGVAAAIRELYRVDAVSSGLNFFLTNGDKLWGFRGCKKYEDWYTLYYYTCSSAPVYCAIASKYPTSTQGNWIALKNFELIELSSDGTCVKNSIWRDSSETEVREEFDIPQNQFDPSANDLHFKLWQKEDNIHVVCWCVDITQGFIGETSSITSQRSSQPSPWNIQVNNNPDLLLTDKPDDGQHAVDVTASGADISKGIFVKVEATFWLTHWNTLRIDDVGWAQHEKKEKAIPNHGWSIDWPKYSPMKSVEYYTHTFTITNDDPTDNLTITELEFLSTMTWYENLTAIRFESGGYNFTLQSLHNWSTGIGTMGSLVGGHIYFKYSIKDASGVVVAEVRADHPVTEPPTEPPKPVGGIVAPVDKFGLLAPYVGLSSTILIVIVVAAVYVKRVKHRKEKQ